MSATIGLFGGTFDPVHNGHLSIAKSFLDAGMIDELWVLLTPYPPHKENSNHTDYALRLKMLEVAFQGWDHTKISTIEQELPKPSYSVQTIRHFKQQHPGHTFYYCIGEDSLRQFHSWKKYKEILEECDLLVARRPGVSHSEVQAEILKHTHFVDHEPLDISSSGIRDYIQSHQSVSKKIPPDVLTIIEKKQLYT